MLLPFETEVSPEGGGRSGQAASQDRIKVWVILLVAEGRVPHRTVGGVARVLEVVQREMLYKDSLAVVLVTDGRSSVRGPQHGYLG